MRAIIVGAGLGGLTTALRLHHKGTNRHRKGTVKAPKGLDCEIHEQRSPRSPAP